MKLLSLLCLLGSAFGHSNKVDFFRGNEVLRTDCPHGTVCRPFTHCLSLYTGEQPGCRLGVHAGVCCPTGPSEPAIVPQVDPASKDAERVFPPQINRGELASAAVESDDIVEQQRRRNYEMIKNGQVPDAGSFSAIHHKFKRVHPYTGKIGEDGWKFVEASKILAGRNRLSPKEAARGLRGVNIDGSPLRSSCPPDPTCDATYPYRTTDGSCNNLKYPKWGQSNRPYQRILHPQYSDPQGLYYPRIYSHVTGKPLPSPRAISYTVFPDRYAAYENINLWVMQWGQMLNHDLTFAGTYKLDYQNSVGIECCSRQSTIMEPPPHPACFPIWMAGGDPDYGKYGQQCMNMVRTLIAPCSLGYADQLNGVTSYIDLSVTYGSTDSVNQDLRTFSDGLLKTTVLPGGHVILPECTHPPEYPGQACFKAGDQRVNTSPGLATLQLVWVRFHNVIAAGLKALNPTWNDEYLYQEARKITVAVYQHITYKEYLPTLIGYGYLAARKLLPLHSGYKTDYDDQLDATTISEFAGAGFRMHSQIPGIWTLGYRSKPQIYWLRDHMDNPAVMYNPETIEAVIQGISQGKTMITDGYMTKEMTNYLLKGTKPFGGDIVSLNINRGWDHGYPAYSLYREACGLRRVTTWESLKGSMPNDAINRLRKVYEHPEDIDLWVGGTLEKHLPGTRVGNTWLCIQGEQFYRAQKGDRFYYEYQSAGFTQAQLDSIRKMSFARVLCDVSDIGSVTPNAFYGHTGVYGQPGYQSSGNPLLSCDHIPGLDLSLWESSK